MNKERAEALMAQYKRLRVNPANDDTTDGQLAAQAGVTIDDLQEAKRMCPERMREVLEARRTLYHDELLEIDRALFERAKAGDTKAADLVYRRFENWTPKQAEADAKRNPTQKTFAQLVEEAQDDE